MSKQKNAVTNQEEPAVWIPLAFPVRNPEAGWIREDRDAGEKWGKSKERQKETGFLGIRMLELNRHLDRRERGGDGGGGRWMVSDTGIRKAVMGLQLGNGIGIGIAVRNIYFWEPLYFALIVVFKYDSDLFPPWNCLIHHKG